MPTPPDPTPPRYHTVTLRVPAFSGGAVAAAVIAALLVAGAVWGGWHAWQSHEAKGRLAQAQTAMEGTAREAAARNGARLDQAEGALQLLGQSVDRAQKADSSDAININGYLDGEGHIHQTLDAVKDDLAGLETQTDTLRAQYRLPSGAALLSSGRQHALDTLSQRAAADADQLAALDGQVQQAAQRRQTLVKAEATARAKALANAESRRNTVTAGETAPSPPPSPAYAPAYGGYYYDYPYYPYYYGYPSASFWIGGGWGGHYHGGYHGGGGHHH